jgi:hypothetical protein
MKATKSTALAACLLAGMALPGAATANAIHCQTAINHSVVDELQRSSCLDAVNTPGRSFIAGNFFASFWHGFRGGAVGIKFGSGAQAVYLAQLENGVISAAWDFAGRFPSRGPSGGDVSPGNPPHAGPPQGNPPHGNPPQNLPPAGLPTDDYSNDIPVVAVPEPTTLGLFGISLAGLAFAGRRRREPR